MAIYIKKSYVFFAFIFVNCNFIFTEIIEENSLKNKAELVARHSKELFISLGGFLKTATEELSQKISKYMHDKNICTVHIDASSKEEVLFHFSGMIINHDGNEIKGMFEVGNLQKLSISVEEKILIVIAKTDVFFCSVAIFTRKESTQEWMLVLRHDEVMLDDLYLSGTKITFDREKEALIISIPKMASIVKKEIVLSYI